MADQKISQLPTITGANMADNDKFVLVDTSGDATVATTRAEFFKSIPNLTTTGTLSVNKTSGYGAVEVGGPSGGLIDLKAPFSDDYDARIIYNNDANLVLTTLAADEPIILKQGNSTRLSTTTTGIQVTGTLTAGNMNITNAVTAGNINITNGQPTLTLTDTDVADEYTSILNSSGSTFIDSRNGVSNGQIVFRGAGGGVAEVYARFTASGKFGVGTSSPSGKIHSVAANNQVAVMAGGDVSDPLYPAFGFDGQIGSNGGRGAGMYLPADSNLAFSTAGSEALRIDSSGRVGIGITLPSANLHVSSTGDTIARITSADGNGAFLDLGDASDPDGGRIVYDSGSNLSFSTASQERMRIKSDGKVGISQTAPAALLHVGDGTNELGTTSGNSLSNFILQTDTTNTDLLLFTTRRTANGSDWTTAAHRIQRKVDTTIMGYMEFGHNTSSLITFGEANTEYARIDGGGAFHVGRTTNDFTDAGFSTTPNGLTAMTRSNDLVLLLNRHTENNGEIAQFRRNNIKVGSINVSAGATAYLTSSDYRLKENVVGLTGASARVNQLKPSRFNFISNEPNILVDGFLAHEVATIVPEAITGTKDAMMDEEYEITPAVLDEGGFEVVTEAVMGTRSVPDYQGIDQSKLVPLLTAALQEALAEIASLKTRVEALEG